jgi:hypothetical protein
MKILFRAYFHQKIFQKKFAENLLGPGSGSGSGRFLKSDPNPVKNRPDPQHCLKVSRTVLPGPPILPINSTKNADHIFPLLLLFSAAGPHTFFAAPTLDENFDAAPTFAAAPAPILINTNPAFCLKQNKTITLEAYELFWQFWMILCYETKPVIRKIDR